MNCTEVFKEIYLCDPEDVSFCPYRICPLGAHIDHNLGVINGLAIDKGISMAYKRKKNGVVELSSLQFDKRAQWHIREVDEEKTGDWADYLRGATFELSLRHKLKYGICGVIEGSLPIGGLSSSAAVTICFIKALAKVNEIELEDKEIIEMALSSERNYVGVSCGKLDQSCEVYSKKDHLLCLDTKDDSYRLIPLNRNMKPFDILIIFSGVERSLAGSRYNMRVDELKSAAYALEAYEGMEYGKFKDTFMRDVPYEVYLKHKDKLPENFRKRADHYFSEFDRAQKGAKAWEEGNLEEYGKLVFESGRSSIESWETGSDELKEIYEIMTRTDGIYGGRFSGAGFKGCLMALIDPEKKDEIIEKITSEYLKSFPELSDKFKCYICHSANGVGK